jgi:GTP-binding protein
MISATCESIKQEYDILINELKKYNPELLDKKRLIAISKSDLIDEEIENWYRSELKGVELIFISSIANKNLDKLKDKLWEMMTAED